MAVGDAEGIFRDSSIDLDLILISKHNHFKPTTRPQHLDLPGHHTTPGRKTNVSSHLSPLHMLAAASWLAMQCHAALPIFEYILRERSQQSHASYSIKTPNIGKRMREEYRRLRRLQLVLKLYCPWPSWISAGLHCILLPSRESSCDPLRSSHAWCHPPPNLPLAL